MEEYLDSYKVNIISWYPFEKESKILVSSNVSEIIVSFLKQNGFYVDKELNKDTKYDYIILISDDECDFKIYSSNLNKDGKIIFITNNKFGLMNWNEGNDLKNGNSKNRIESQILKSGFKHFKYYYVFQNYNNANLIVSDSYKLTDEDITRNFPIYDKDKILFLNENSIYQEFLNNGKEDLIKEFANSFFIEISNKDIKTDVKYVSFTNYRKDEYKIATIVKSNEVDKKALNEKAQSHIDNMMKSVEKMKQIFPKNIKIYGYMEENKFVTEFIKEKRFDEYLFDVKTIPDLQKSLSILFLELLKNSQKFEDFVNGKDYINNPEFLACIKFYDSEKIKKLHFVEDAFVDLIPKNCFINKKKELLVIDQEWVMKNIPVEFIFYRAFLNTSVVSQKFNLDEVLKAYNLFDYKDLFIDIENVLNNKILDEKIHPIIFRKYEHFSDVQNKLLDYENKIINLNQKLDALEKQKSNLIKENENYKNQLTIISKSFSYKLMKPFRILNWMFNPFNGATFIDRIMPPGGRRRAEYDEKQTKIKYEKQVENYFKLTDNETAEYWKGMDHRRVSKLQKDWKLRDENKLNDYEKWCVENTLSDKDIEKQISTKFKYRPKISIVVPLYNTKTDLFRELLYTVHLQTYSNWELCLADGSDKPLIEIQKMVEKDSRIKYKFLNENKGISENSNEALKLTTGDYIALLDHDDLLTRDTLFEVVKELNKNRNLKFIYTDEDKIHFIDESRFEPNFKPDFSLDTLLSQNYICHFSVFKKELLEKIGYFNKEYDGAQDYDLILRAVENCSIDEIKHISKILYHWRVTPESTAGNLETKFYAYEAGRKAIKAYLERQNINADVKSNKGYFEVVYDNKKDLSASIIIMYEKNIDNLKELLLKLNSLEEKFEVIICSFENNLEEKLKEYSCIKYVYDETGNYASVYNKAADIAKNDYLIFLNSNLKIENDKFINYALNQFARKDLGAIAGKVIYSDDTIKSCGAIFDKDANFINAFSGIDKNANGYFEYNNTIRNISAISKDMFIIEKDLFEKVGKFNEMFSNYYLYLDLSMKILNNNKNIIYAPNEEFIINEPKNMQIVVDAFNNERNAFAAMWNEKLSIGDKNYNRNLKLEDGGYMVKTYKVD